MLAMKIHFQALDEETRSILKLEQQSSGGLLAKRPGAQEGLLFGKSAATSDSSAVSQGHQVSALVANKPAEQMKSLRIREG